MRNFKLEGTEIKVQKIQHGDMYLFATAYGCYLVMNCCEHGDEQSGCITGKFVIPLNTAVFYCALLSRETECCVNW